MTTRLEAFRDHCKRMAKADHKPDCAWLTWRKPWWPGWVPTDGSNPMDGLTWIGPPPNEPPWTRPECAGCLTDADRALFARLATEVDEYQQLTLEDA